MKKRPKRILPMIKLVTINDPHNPGIKMMTPPEFLTKNYIKVDTEEEFRKYFHPMYHSRIIPYLGTHYIGYIHKDHPFFIKSETAIAEKMDMILDTKDEQFINALLKEKRKDENNMSVSELKEFIETATLEKASRVEKDALLKKSGVEREIKRDFAIKKESIYNLSIIELKALIKAKKGGK